MDQKIFPPGFFGIVRKCEHFVNSLNWLLVSVRMENE